MDNHDTIVDYIQHFRGSETTFLTGCCYWFAYILYKRFELTANGADIKYEPIEGHFVVKIGERYYDIRGDVTAQYQDKFMYDISDMMHHDFKMYRHLMRDCRDFLMPEDV